MSLTRGRILNEDVVKSALASASSRETPSRGTVNEGLDRTDHEWVLQTAVLGIAACLIQHVYRLPMNSWVGQTL